MGPYLPELISPELNLVIALFLGIAFGFVLEQAGFSDSRRLAGLFYGYDFVVLRVFFTAAVTAMVGISLLAYFGLINLEMIYVNPLFTRSAIVGGVVMGLGFVLGGFCPGTSICAAAIGRIDAIFFVLGTLLGVFVYTEIYPFLSDFVVADAQGGVLAQNVFGLTRGLFILMVATMALIAFFVTKWIENRVNNRQAIAPLFAPRPAAIAISALALITLVVFLPDKKTQARSLINNDAELTEVADIRSIELEQLVIRLLDRDNSLILVDVRSRELFDTGHLPTAVNIPLDKLTASEWSSFLNRQDKQYVFYAGLDDSAKKAVLMMSRLNNTSNQMAFEGGYSEYIERFYGDSLENKAFARFRAHAVPELEKIAVEAEKVVVKPENKLKVQGGC
ncbi:YeeE/YedE family protein [bacterium]|nr:YeeE/YedE family protein [bacterium]